MQLAKHFSIYYHLKTRFSSIVDRQTCRIYFSAFVAWPTSFGLPLFTLKPQVIRSALQSGNTRFEFYFYRSSSGLHILQRTQGVITGFPAGKVCITVYITVLPAPVQSNENNRVKFIQVSTSIATCIVE